MRFSCVKHSEISELSAAEDHGVWVGVCIKAGKHWKLSLYWQSQGCCPNCKQSFMMQSSNNSRNSYIAYVLIQKQQDDSLSGTPPLPW